MRFACFTVQNNTKIKRAKQMVFSLLLILVITICTIVELNAIINFNSLTSSWNLKLLHNALLYMKMLEVYGVLPQIQICRQVEQVILLRSLMRRVSIVENQDLGKKWCTGVYHDLYIGISRLNFKYSCSG